MWSSLRGPPYVGTTWVCLDDSTHPTLIKAMALRGSEFAPALFDEPEQVRAVVKPGDLDIWTIFSPRIDFSIC